MPEVIILQMYIVFILIFLIKSASASESLDYSIEHLVESAMNARYASFQELELTRGTHYWRSQTGFFHADGAGVSSNGWPNAIQYNLSEIGRWSYNVGFFFDVCDFSSRGESAYADLSDTPTVGREPVPVKVQSVQGYSIHAGPSFSLAYYFSMPLAWQVGAAAEYYRLNNFKVKVLTTNQSPDYTATLDYSASYHALTPFTSLQWFITEKPKDMAMAGRLLVAMPLPRRDFQVEMTTPHNRYEKNGKGKHIPDVYVGLGLWWENIPKGWRVDLGTALYYYLVEGQMHKGISHPVNLNFSWHY